MPYSFVSFGRNACLFCLFLLVTAYSAPAKAGCPTDISPTSGPGSNWIQHTRCFDVAGMGCDVMVTFCRRTVNGVIETYIDKIEKCPNGDWGAGCNSLKWVDIIHDIRNQLLKDVGSADDCGGPGLPTVSNVYTGMCISFVVQNGVWSANFCAEGVYCKKTCEICIGPSGLVLQNCTTTIIGTPECESLGGMEDLTVEEVEMNSWGGSYAQCYLVDCDD